MSERRAFSLLCAGTFFHFLAMGVFLSGLPLFVSEELRGSKAAVGLAVGAFSVTAVLTRPFIGRRVDRVGRVPFLRAAPVLVGLSAVALLGARSLPVIVAIRMLQGVAGSSFYTAAATVTTDMAPADSRAGHISRFSLFLYAGFAAGPAVGEALIEARGYSAAWLFALAASTVAVSIVWFVPETKPTDLSLEPLVKRRRFVHPAAVGPGLVLLTVAVGYTAISSFLPLYARSIGMQSSGTLYVTFAMTILVVRLVSGRLADRLGNVKVALPGLFSGAAGMAVLATVPSPAAAYVGVALFGTAHALVFPALMSMTVDRVDERERGEALGSFTASFDLGAATGGYLVGFIADQAGYRAAWALPGVVCLIGAAGLVTMARRSPPAGPHSADTASPMEPAGA